MPAPGPHGNLSNQTILQRATVRPLGNPVLGDRTYRSDNPVWLVPNFHLVYRHQRWAGFTALQTILATKDGAGRFTDGRRSRLDLPRTWRFGLGWQATPRLRASLGLNAYLEHSARMALLDDPADGIDARRDYRNTYEQSAALECRIGAACTGFAQRYRSADAGDRRLQAAFAANGAAISPDKEYAKRYLILAFGIEYHLAM